MSKSTTHPGASTGWRQLLRDRNVRWLFAGQTVSQVGDGVSKVALLWFVYAMTDSALKMSLIGVLQTIPPLVFGPLAGVLLDRLDKRRAMIVIDLVRTGLLASIPILHALGLLTLPLLYVLVFVIAMFSMAFGPALNATLPLVVKKEQLTGVNALMQSAMTIGQLLGPALSGMLIAAIGAQNALYANAAAFFLSALCKIPLRLPHVRVHRSSDNVWTQAVKDLKDGIRFVFVKQRLLFLLMIVASIFTLGSTAFVYLLPVIGDRLLHVGSVALGWLWSSLSLGILATTVWLIWKPQQTVCARIWMIAIAAAIAAVAVPGLLMSDSMLWAGGLIVAIGATSGLITPLVSASLQERTPKDLMARVFGLFNTGTMVFSMIGMTLFGWVADRFGRVSLAAIGVVNGAAAIVSMALLPWCYRLAKETCSRPAQFLRRAS
jgi:DHA3 family macrolide efflux protein-like MFS transporter